MGDNKMEKYGVPIEILGDLLKAVNNSNGDLYWELRLNDNLKYQNSMIYYNGGKVCDIYKKVVSIKNIENSSYNKDRAVDLREFKGDKNRINSETLYDPAKIDKLINNIKMIIDNFQKKQSRNKKLSQDWENNITQNMITVNSDIFITIQYQPVIRKIDKSTSNNKFSDLLVYFKNKGNFAFVEVKTKTGALEGKSGIETHLDDFSKLIGSGIKNYYNEIKSLIDIKKPEKLGLLQKDIPSELDCRLDFVFCIEESIEGKFREIIKAKAYKFKELLSKIEENSGNEDKHQVYYTFFDKNLPKIKKLSLLRELL
jgi:hypothetical protein